MFGWTVEQYHIGQPDNCACILGENGKVYFYHIDKKLMLSNNAYVSFSSNADFDTTEEVMIEEVIGEAPKTNDFIFQINQKVKRCLSQKQYLHSFRVSIIARSLAKQFGLDSVKAEIAGLVHDIAKEKTREENTKIIKEAHMPISSFELLHQVFLHAAAGSILASTELGITDEEILNAVRYHNGRPAMNPIENILYVADHMDYCYKYNNITFDFTKEKDLTQVTHKLMMFVNLKFARNHARPDMMTEWTMDYMLADIQSRVGKESPFSEGQASISDELFDKILEINRCRAVKIKSVSNIRDLGGCKTFDDKEVRKGVLVRSGRLNNLCNEDADFLKSYGIDTIIDLREEKEKKECPDKNIDGFQYVECPLPSIEETDYHENLKEKYILTESKEEKSFYLNEYLSCISMEEMYVNILTKSESIKNLKRIFTILLDSNTHGVLFHCTSGKDRTGVVAALILLTLGVKLEDIQDDYYTSALAKFSETEFYAQSLRKQRYTDAVIDEMRYYNGVGMNIAKMLLDDILNQYESVESYLFEELGVSADNLCELRKKYVQ